MGKLAIHYLTTAGFSAKPRIVSAEHFRPRATRPASLQFVILSLPHSVEKASVLDALVIT
jgi:hypothetical protein